MMSSRIFGVVLILASMTALLSANEQKIAFVTELHQLSDRARSLELFPEKLDVEIETDEGVQVLNLVKQKSLNVRSIPFQYDVPELNKREFKLVKEVAFYQDLENMVPIRVEATIDGGAVKRTLTGTMIHNKRAYEIHPGSSFLQSMSDILDERGLGSEHQHSVHVLKRVNMGDYLRSHDIKLTADQEEKRKELEKKAKEEKTLKTFLRLLSADDKNVDLERSKRYASRTTTVFHVEMLFVVDYSVYKFWMGVHNNSVDEVHETLMHYYTQIFNGIHMSFRRIDYDKHGIAIVLWLTKIHFITDPANQVAIPQDIYQGQAEEDHVFEAMANFLTKNNYTWTYPDHSMLWTKSDLAADYSEYYGKLTADLLGVAYMCRICHPGESFSLNEDNGFYSWATGAHEFAHNIGSNHDGTGGNKCDPNEVYLMYVSDYTLDGDIVKTAFEFSDCSVEEFKTCIAGKAESNLDWPLVCVYDTVCEHNVPLDHVDDLPGQMYNLTEQCQLFMDPTSSFEPCAEETANVCESMECYIPAEKECSTQFTEFRAAPGTPCNGSSPNSVCSGDDCVCYEGRCMDSSNIKTIEDEQKPSCSDVKYTPPEGCINTGSVGTCTYMTLQKPWRCFTSAYFSEACKASCYEFGLFYVDEPPCPLPAGGQVPEEETPSQPQPKPGSPQFCQQMIYGKEGGMSCPDDPTYCIPMSWFCDGEPDCDDGSDEKVDMCIQVPCSIKEGEDFYLRCKEDPAYCFKESYHNDKYKDCPKGSDEDTEWFETAPRYCFNRFEDQEGFNCPNNHTKCIPAFWLCDGEDDCNTAAGEIGDESVDFCDGVSCRKNQLRCPNEEGEHTLTCIKKRQACNGKPNCPNGKDEVIDWCLSKGVEPVCEPEETMCPGMETFQCIAKSKACDLTADCDGGKDEEVAWCEEEGITLSCAEGQIMCPDKTQSFGCIDRSALCDGTEDCAGGADEVTSFCVTLGCPVGEVACPAQDGPVTCISWKAGCDGVEDCSGGGDENKEWCYSLNSLSECASGQVLCPNAESPTDCVRVRYACDHWGDCKDDADEDKAWCKTLPAATCRDDQFMCVENSFRCVLKKYMCDGLDDCGDNSDETAADCNNNNEVTSNRRLLAEAEKALRMLEIAKERDLEQQKAHAFSKQEVKMQTRKRTGSSVQRRKRATGDSKVDQDREAELRSLLEAVLKKSRNSDDNDDAEAQPKHDEQAQSEHTLVSLKKNREENKRIYGF